jgi:hypothetical protein
MSRFRSFRPGTTKRARACSRMDCSVTGALGTTDHKSLDASLYSTLEARPPALRARCGRLVYQYESTGVNTKSCHRKVNKHALSRG